MRALTVLKQKIKERRKLRGSVDLRAIFGVALAIVGLIVALYVVSTIHQAMPAPDTNSPFYEAYTKTTQYGGVAFTLLAVGLIIGGAVLLIWILRGALA